MATKKTAPKKAAPKLIDRILSIDIGGTHIKTAVLNSNGKLLTDYTKLPTPDPATPDAVLSTIVQLTKDLSFDAVSAGFPGYVKHGIVYTAPNLGTENWAHFAIEKMLSKTLLKPARVVNDADMQGLGLVSGRGIEMVITLGTGCGTALFNNGVLMPHLELSHHPIKDGKDYDAIVGAKALAKHGKKRWNKNLELILFVLKTVVNYDTLYIGGGNAKKINFDLDDNIKIVTNLEGIDGGAKLWQQ